MGETKPVLSDDDVQAELDAMEDASERKQWLMDAWGAGRITGDQVSLFFYVYDLKEA